MQAHVSGLAVLVEGFLGPRVPEHIQMSGVKLDKVAYPIAGSDHCVDALIHCSVVLVKWFSHKRSGNFM